MDEYFEDGDGNQYIGNADGTWNSLTTLNEVNVSRNKDTNSSNNYMAGALLISTGLVADDWTGIGFGDDIAIPFIIGGAYILSKINAGNGNKLYPGPWSYTYQHPSQNPINNPPNSFEPNQTPPNISTASKLLFAGKLAYELYDEYQVRMNQIESKTTIVRDNTYVVQPQFIPNKRK